MDLMNSSTMIQQPFQVSCNPHAATYPFCQTPPTSMAAPTFATPMYGLQGPTNEVVHPLQSAYQIPIQSVIPQVQQQIPFSPQAGVPPGYTLVGVPYPQPQYVPVMAMNTNQGVQYRPVYVNQTQPQPAPLGKQMNCDIANVEFPQLPSNSTSFSRANSKCSSSFDGSEVSENDGKDTASSTVSLKRYNSDVSRDGYGSDLERSLSTDVKNEENVESPAHMMDTSSLKLMDTSSSVKNPESPALMTSFDSLMNSETATAAPTYQTSVYQPLIQPRVTQLTDTNPASQTFGVNFLTLNMQNTSPLMQPMQPMQPTQPEESALTNYLRTQSASQLQRYMNRLRDPRGGEMFRIPDRVKKTRPTSKERQEELFKTELCTSWVNGQKCRFGKKCIFAHGAHEIRQPQRKVERMKRKAPLHKDILTALNNLNDQSFDAVSTEIISRCVEEIKDRQMVNVVTRSVFNHSCNEAARQPLYAKMWHKLLNVHDFKVLLNSEMLQCCLNEYAKPRSKLSGLNNMSWIAHLVKRKIMNADVVHKILGDMCLVKEANEDFEYNVELWCKLIGSVSGSVDTSRYFSLLANFKAVVGGRVHFLILDLEDLRNRNWVPRT